MGIEKIEGLPSTTPITHWYKTRAHLSGELQRDKPFRKETIKHNRYYIGVDDDDELTLMRFEKYGPATNHSSRLILDDIEPGHGIELFGETSYQQALEALLDHMDMDSAECARKFGVIELPEGRDQEPRWQYHPALGFYTLPVRQ